MTFEILLGSKTNSDFSVWTDVQAASLKEAVRWVQETHNSDTIVRFGALKNHTNLIRA